MRYPLLAGMLAILCQQPVFASAQSYSTFGDGTESCGAYVQAAERERSNPASPTYIRDPYYLGFTSFANGYLSGANMMALVFNQPGELGSGTDVHGRMVWLQNWCKDHPLSMFADAVAALVVFLKTQKP